MSINIPKPITEVSDKELRELLRRTAPRVDVSHAQLLEEGRNRTSRRHADASFVLALVIGVATVVNVAVDVLR